MSSSDETYCSEIEKTTPNQIRRSSRIAKGKRKDWRLTEKENRYKKECRVEEREKKHSKVLEKNISNQDYDQINWKTSKFRLQKKNHDVKQNKPKKGGRSRAHNPVQYDQENHAREKLMQWSKQIHQHISGRHIDYQKATHILSELNKIRDICIKNSSNMQVWEKLEHQLSYIMDEQLSRTAIDSRHLQSTNQVVQQSEGLDKGQFHLDATNHGEGSQSILKEQCYNNSYCHQKPLTEDFENLIQKTEISRNMQNVNNHCTPNYNNLAESETQCEFPHINIPNCDSVRQNMESMNLVNLSHSPDVIPDSQNTQPASLNKVTRGSHKHNLKYLSDRMVKLKISKQKKMKKISEGSKPQCFRITDKDNSILNNNHLPKNRSITLTPMNQGIFANTLQNYVPIVKQNACKKKVQFSTPFAPNSLGLNSLLISPQTENQTQEPRPVNRTQEVCLEYQTQELGSLNRTIEFDSETQMQDCSVNQSQKFGLENQRQKLESVNRTIEFDSENQTQELGPVNRTIEFDSENQTQEIGPVNRTIEFDSENQTQELGPVNRTIEFDSENQTQELGPVNRTIEFDSENQTQEIDSVHRPQKETSTINSSSSTSKVLPASVNSSLGWIKSMKRVYKVDPTEWTALSMLPKSFQDGPLANLPTEWETDFDIW